MEAMKQKAVKGYELKERIGTGGFGAVYRAYQTAVGREVAVKIILPALANQADFIRRFEGEAQVVARLEHPHITPLYDYWRDPEGAYLVMRWLKGGSLHDALERGCFELRAAASLLDQIAGALSLAHRNGIIHRDIKPANILLDEDGNAYLTDFGIAKDLNIQGSNTQPDMIVGSLDYISPEQARSEPVTNRTDIYSLGVTLYEIITGHHPFENLSSIERLYKHINDPLPEITSLDAAIVTDVNRVIQKATAKNPEQRYADALAFSADFREAIGLNRASTTVVELLTQREHEILQLIIEGLSNKEIAQRLTITHGTVKWYVNQIYDKLGVRSRVQAMVRARELNLLVKGNGALEALQIATEDFQPDNPYKGLRAFQSADNQDFFGREKITTKLLKRMGERADFGRFLAVVGPSGSGKSSLVKAGLIPALWRGEIPSSEKWYIVEMTPATHPMDELEIALTKLAANQAGNLHEHLQRNENGLVRAASLILPNDDTELVLVIDQFEEVFTMSDDETERKHFLDLLYAAVNNAKSRLRVIITLRADFYDRPLHYPHFGEMLRSRLETILPLSAEELERAISKPAERVGAVFEAGLVASMVADLNYQAGALPLLQYALTELFEHRKGRLLSREAYEAMGKSTGALAKRADEIYEGFDDEGKAAAKQLFLRLVLVTDGVEDTRRRASRSDLLALGDAEVMEDVIDTFASYRLLTLDNDPTSREPVVEVAHEAILREWQQLRDWLKESREDLRIQRQVAGMTSEWADAKREKSFLARGSRLDCFEELVENTELLLTPLELEFIAKSVEGRQAEAKKEAEQEKREQRLEQRSQRFLRALVAVFALATLLSGGLAVFAFAQEAESDANLLLAQEAQAISEANFALSESQRLAAEANLLQQRDVMAETTALLSMRALNSAYSPQADMALQRASHEQYGRLLFTAWDIAFVHYSHDGNLIVNVLYNSTVQLRNAQTGDLIWELVDQFDSVPFVSISPDNQYLLVADEDEAIYLLSVDTGEELRQFTNPDTETNVNAVFSADGRMILVTGNVVSWTADFEAGNISNIRNIDLPHADVDASPSAYASFSADGRFVGTFNFANTTAEVWDLATNQMVQSFTDERLTAELVFSPDNRYLAINTIEYSIILWDIASGEQVHEFIGHTQHVAAYKFSTDGHYFATGSLDTTARIWDIQTGLEVRQFNAHTNGVFSLAFAPDGRNFLTGSRDSTARLWDLQAPSSYDVLNGTPSTYPLALTYSPDSRQIATATGGDIYLWDSASHELQAQYHLFGALQVAVQGLRYSPDGRYLLAAGYGDGVVLLDLESGDAVHTWSGSGFNGPISLTPDGQSVIISNQTGLTIWDLESGEALRQFTDVVGNSYLTYSPDGRYLLTAGPQYSGSEAYLWDAATGEQLRTFTGHVGDINSLAFSPDGQIIAAGGNDATVILWNVETGEQVQTLTGHGGRIWAVNFSRDGRFLLSGAQDSTARLWDLETGQELRRFVGDGYVMSTIFSADENAVLIGTSDGNIYLTPISIEELADSVCSRVQRDLTALDRVQYSIRDDSPTCPNN